MRKIAVCRADPDAPVRTISFEPTIWRWRTPCWGRSDSPDPGVADYSDADPGDPVPGT